MRASVRFQRRLSAFSAASTGSRPVASAAAGSRSSGAGMVSLGASGAGRGVTVAGGCEGTEAGAAAGVARCRTWTTSPPASVLAAIAASNPSSGRSPRLSKRAWASTVRMAAANAALRPAGTASGDAMTVRSDGLSWSMGQAASPIAASAVRARINSTERSLRSTLSIPESAVRPTTITRTGSRAGVEAVAADASRGKSGGSFISHHFLRREAPGEQKAWMRVRWSAVVHRSDRRPAACAFLRG